MYLNKVQNQVPLTSFCNQLKLYALKEASEWEIIV